MPIRITDKGISELACDVSVDQVNSEACTAMRNAAGPRYRAACEKYKNVSVGSVYFVSGFALKSKYIAGIAAPVWRGGMFGEWELLASCYTAILDAAVSRRCKSVAFPLLSSGACGFPSDKLMSTATEAINRYLKEHDLDVYISVPRKNEYSVADGIIGDISGFINKARAQADAGLRSDADFAFTSPGGNASLYSSSSGALFDTHAGYDINADPSSTAPGLADMLKKMDRGFADTLFYYIDKKGISDIECYKRANVDKKTFSKIKCNSSYKPSKVTAVSFAIALHLNLSETGHLLNTVGMSLSRSSVFDVIIEYFITTGNYETIHDVNQTLYQFDQVLLGC